MNVILSLILFIIALRILLNRYPIGSRVRDKIESHFCLIVYCIVILLAAFRGESVGADTLSYLEDYEGIKYLSFSDIAVRYKGYVGFYFLSKVFSLMSAPVWVWFGFLEIVYVSSIKMLIDRYSTDKLYSIVLFVSLGLFMFSLAGLKQTLAMALVLFGYLCFVDKKYILSVLFCILSYFSHPSALILLLGFFLYVIRNKPYFLIVTLSIVLIIVFGSKMFVNQLVSFVGDEHYERYLDQESTYSAKTLFLFVLLIIVSLPYYRHYRLTTSESQLFFALIVIGCALQNLASLNPSLFRLAYPYITFYLVYLPNVFDAKSNNDLARTMKTITLLGVIVFALYANRELVFTFS